MAFSAAELESKKIKSLSELLQPKVHQSFNVSNLQKKLDFALKMTRFSILGWLCFPSLSAYGFPDVL